MVVVIVCVISGILPSRDIFAFSSWSSCGIFSRHNTGQLFVVQVKRLTFVRGQLDTSDGYGVCDTHLAIAFSDCCSQCGRNEEWRKRRMRNEGEERGKKKKCLLHLDSLGVYTILAASRVWFHKTQMNVPTTPPFTSLPALPPFEEHTIRIRSIALNPSPQPLSATLSAPDGC